MPAPTTPPPTWGGDNVPGLDPLEEKRAWDDFNTPPSASDPDVNENNGGAKPAREAAEAYLPGQHWTKPVLPQREWSAASMPSKVDTPFNADAFERLLKNYPLRELVEYILKGLRGGFDTGTDVKEERVDSPNLRSATLQPKAISEWLEQEVARGHMEVFDHPPHEFYRTCGVGVVPKPAGADGKPKWRLISDFSRPGSEGQQPINDGIDVEQYRLRMLSIWDVVDLMVELGADAHWSAIDCSWGYRQLPVHPAVYHCQVYYWIGEDGVGRWYVDYRLVFGSSSSAGIYNSVMEGVEWIVQDRIDRELGVGEAFCRHYLDDFWSGGRSKRSCETATAIMLDTFEELGIPLQRSKSQLNVVVGIYLGVLLNARRLDLEVPAKKKKAVTKQLHLLDAKAGASIKKKELQSLVGRLTWGNLQWFRDRPLINPLLHALASQPREHGRVKITPGLERAAKQWLHVIETSPPRLFATRPRVLAASVNAAQCWEEDSAVFVGDASAENGFGWFGRIAVRMALWTKDERSSASACAGSSAAADGAEPIKNSSTLQELRCLADAVGYWLRTTPSAPTCTYLTDADNLVHLFRKGRSGVRAINDELHALGEKLRAGDKAVKVVWHSREDGLARAADALSRSDVAKFQVIMAECFGQVHPAVDLGTGASGKTAI